MRKRKILELDAMLEDIQSMRGLVEQQEQCRCTAREECGKKMFEKQCDKGGASVSTYLFGCSSPLCLHVRWEVFQVAKKRNRFPDVLVRHLTLPSTHAGVAYTIFHNPEHLPVGFDGWLSVELRDTWIECRCPPMAGFAGIAVTS